MFISIVYIVTLRAEDKLKAEGKYEEHYNEINNKTIDGRIE